MRTSELTGAKLREWVARAQGWKVEIDVDSLICFDESGTAHSFGEFGYCPDVNWAQGGPIIERERINLTWLEPSDEYPEAWSAQVSDAEPRAIANGEIPLVAAMRAYCASKYGDTVPDEVA
jgi:hypothetical protein